MSEDMRQQFTPLELIQKLWTRLGHTERKAHLRCATIFTRSVRVCLAWGVQHERETANRRLL
jgi:hypothetical protein